MTNVTVFLVAVGSTALASFCAVAYMTPSLRRILIDLCGTEDRANFWLAFSNLSLILMPLIFAMHQIPDGNSQISPVFQLGSQIESALIGLVVTVLGLGLVLWGFIPRQNDKLAVGERYPIEGAIGGIKTGATPTNPGSAR